MAQTTSTRHLSCFVNGLLTVIARLRLGSVYHFWSFVSFIFQWFQRFCFSQFFLDCKKPTLVRNPSIPLAQFSPQKLLFPQKAPQFWLSWPSQVFSESSHIYGKSSSWKSRQESHRTDDWKKTSTLVRNARLWAFSSCLNLRFYNNTFVL